MCCDVPRRECVYMRGGKERVGIVAEVAEENLGVK